MKYCPKCGAPMRDNEAFCGKCGEKSGRPEAAPTVHSDIQQAHPGKNAKIIAGAVIAVLLIAGGFLAWNFTGKDQAVQVNSKSPTVPGSVQPKQPDNDNIISKYRSIQCEAKVRSDAATAQTICAAARLQETNDNKVVNSYNEIRGDYINNRSRPLSSPEGTFILCGGGPDPYQVTWTPTDAAEHNVQQTVIEGEAFALR